MRIALAASLLALFAGPAAHAAERGFTITSFDHIRVEGSFDVQVITGRGSSARATGSADALDAIALNVNGTTLVIRRKSGWDSGYDEGPVTIRLTTPGLMSAMLAGSGSLAVDAMRAARVTIGLDGSGSLSVGAIQTDRLTAAMAGSGAMRLAGKSAIATYSLRGSGSLEATALAVADADVRTEGSGSVKLRAIHSAKVAAGGSGSVVVAGSPACTVNKVGSATVRCGTRG